jgi:hypothetical protein
MRNTFGQPEEKETTQETLAKIEDKDKGKKR